MFKNNRLEGRRGGKKLFDGIFTIFTFHKYFPGDQFREDKVREKRDTHGGEERWVEDMVRKTEGMRQFGRHRCRWEDDIKMNLKRNKMLDWNWIHLVESNVCWTVHHCNS